MGWFFLEKFIVAAAKQQWVSSIFSSCLRERRSVEDFRSEKRRPCDLLLIFFFPRCYCSNHNSSVCHQSCCWVGKKEKEKEREGQGCGGGGKCYVFCGWFGFRDKLGFFEWLMWEISVGNHVTDKLFAEAKCFEIRVLSGRWVIARWRSFWSFRSPVSCFPCLPGLRFERGVCASILAGL